jgi:membrane protein YqaA with SNARE-associated domain
MAAVFFAAILDASFLPFPVTTIFVVLSVSRPESMIRYSFLVVTGTITGALVGYLAGRFLWLNSSGGFSSFAHFCFRIIPGFSIDTYTRMSNLFDTWNVGLIVLVSLTAIPFGLISVFAGLLNLPPLLFILSSLLGQTVKYMAVALMIHFYGGRIKQFLKFNWKPWIVSSALVLTVITFILKLAYH